MIDEALLLPLIQASDTNASEALQSWPPELELGDVAQRLRQVDRYLLALGTSCREALDRLARLNGADVLSRALGQTADQVQRQDAVDVGDPDVNEEVVSTLQAMASTATTWHAYHERARRILERMTNQVGEIQDDLQHLATQVAQT